MFAFALWDRRDLVLHLVRDRLGEKPLYYGKVGYYFFFASELKALRAHPAWQGEIDRDALALFLRHNYIPAPYSIFRGIHKLLPGTILSVPVTESGTPPSTWKIAEYWSFREVTEEGRGGGTVPPTQLKDELHHLLLDAVALRMEADVPLGAFLSGGIDSSLIVALMQRQASRPVKTFCVGFREAQYNEAGFARDIARHLGTDHTEVLLTPREVMEVVPGLPHLYDEPFADSSQLPTFLVSRLARQQVVVSLSGDGGDELFGGYNRYFWGRNLWRVAGPLPETVRRAFGRSLLNVSPRAWDHLLGAFGRIAPGVLPSHPGQKVHVLAEVLAAGSADHLYHALVSHWKKPSEVVIGSEEPPTALTDPARTPGMADFTKRMMYLDTVSYLPDDILVKVDRASMGVGLEARVPFLDHRVVEMAWKLPLGMKVRRNQGKWVLREILDNYVPRPLVERPKMGFGVPLDLWLRGPLRDWAEELLSERNLHRDGFFNPAPIVEKWKEHLSGKRNWQYHLWDILVFQAWLESSR